MSTAPVSTSVSNAKEPVTLTSAALETPVNAKHAGAIADATGISESVGTNGDPMVVSDEEINELHASHSTNDLPNNLKPSQRKIKAFKDAKKSAAIDCVKHVLTCTVLMHLTVADDENAALGNACFEGWLRNKERKDASVETANAASNEPRKLPGILGAMQSKI